MKKLLTLGLFVLFFHFVYAQDSWVQLADIKGMNRTSCVAFAAAGKGWVVSGFDGNNFSRKMVSYDVTMNTWNDEASIGGTSGGGLSRASACAFSILNKGYVCLGQGDNADFLKDNWEYDPATSAWTQKADFPGTARRGAVAFVIDNIAYIGTGEDVHGLCKDFFKYDPAENIWGYVADFSGTARKQAISFAIDGKGYLSTGYDGTVKNDLWQFLVFQNMWVQKKSCPGAARSGAVGWAIVPHGYLACGEDDSYLFKNDVWEYNNITDQWRQRSSLPAAARKNAVALVIDGMAYIGTGYTGSFVGDFYAYTSYVGTEEQMTRSVISVFPNPVSGKLCITLPDQKLDMTDMKIFSCEGRDVTRLFLLKQTEKGFESETKGVSAGEYFCVLNAFPAIRSVTKFVVEK